MMVRSNEPHPCFLTRISEQDGRLVDKSWACGSLLSAYSWQGNGLRPCLLTDRETWHMYVEGAVHSSWRCMIVNGQTLFFYLPIVRLLILPSLHYHLSVRPWQTKISAIFQTNFLRKHLTLWWYEFSQPFVNRLFISTTVYRFDAIKHCLVRAKDSVPLARYTTCSAWFCNIRDCLPLN